MTAIKHMAPVSHVVDILGSTKGRDQPIMLVEKALQLAELFDDSVFVDRNTVILDPFCKASEILLATALKSRLIQNNRSQPMASTGEIFHELYSGRYYALAPDKRHYFLSLRTFYGNERSHDASFTHHIWNGKYLSEADGKLDKEKFSEELIAMINFIRKTKPECKIVAIGNPPYHETDGGAKASAKPIFNFFVETLIDSGIINEFSLVLPARWFSAGKNLKSFRERIINCGEVKAMKYFERSEDVFPTVHVQGGICFLNWKKGYSGKATFSYKDQFYETDLSAFDIIPDDPCSTEIINKIHENWNGTYVGDIAWSRKPFGLSTDYFKKNISIHENDEKAIKCYAKSKKTIYLDRAIIKKNKEYIDEWKVAIPRAYATGARRCTLPAHQVFLIEKGAICTETYNIIDSFKTKTEAEKLIKYLQTDFSRYLLGLRKLTQDIPRDRWGWVPLMDTSREWTDDELFDFFKLSESERQHIQRKVQEWS